MKQKKKAKKIDFDNTVKKVENISNKVDIIMRNRLIVAIFLIVDGVTFILNPDTTLSEMARNIILLIILAAFSVLIANLSVKTKDKKTILISVAVIIAAIITYIYPDFIAAYMQLLLSLFIIYDGVKNIANLLHFDKLSKYAHTISEKYNKIVHRKASDEKKQKQREKFKDIDNNINQGLEEQGNKLITPLQNLVNKTSKYKILYIIANSATIILGIILLVFPGVSMTIWGVVFLYTGFSNLFISIKTMDLKRKIKEKKFKEIIFDAEKNTPKNTSKSTNKNNKKDNKKS